MRSLRPNKNNPVRYGASRSASSVKESPNRVDTWLQRLSNFSQPALLCLGIFGYFYTVVPVFQNQQLQEQTAKLELEKSASERQLALLKDQQSEVQQNIQQLKNSWEQERIRNAKLAADVLQANERELIARSKSEKIESTLQQQERSLYRAQWDLLLLDLSLSRHFYSYNKLVEYLNSEGRTSGAFILTAEKFWPKPYEQMLMAIDLAATTGANRDQIPDVYYAETKKFIESSQSSLQCVLPDFEVLHKAYLKDVASLNPGIETELDRQMQSLRDEYAAKNQRVEITENFRSRSRISIRIGREFGVAQTYREKIDALRRECDTKSSLVVDALRKSKHAAR